MSRRSTLALMAASVVLVVIGTQGLYWVGASSVVALAFYAAVGAGISGMAVSWIVVVFRWPEETRNPGTCSLCHSKPEGNNGYGLCWSCFGQFRTCSLCRHWHAPAFEGGSDTYGSCRVRPPGMGRDGRGTWPKTIDTETCGQFSADKERLRNHLATLQSPPTSYVAVQIPLGDAPEKEQA